MPASLRILTLTLISLAASPLALSQEKKMTLKFLAFPSKAQREPIELILNAKETIQIDTPGHRLSDPYEVPAMSQIIIGKTEVGEDGKPKFDIYGKGKALPVKEQIILLFRKGQDDSEGFVVLSVNALNQDFPGGSMMFVNAANTSCGGLVGDKKVLLKPGERKIIKPKADFNNDVAQVSLSYLRDHEDPAKRWKLFRDGRWAVDKDLRTLAFFYQHPKTGKVSIAPVIEQLGADPPPEPNP